MIERAKYQKYPPGLLETEGRSVLRDPVDVFVAGESDIDTEGFGTWEQSFLSFTDFPRVFPSNSPFGFGSSLPANVSSHMPFSSGGRKPGYASSLTMIVASSGCSGS